MAALEATYWMEATAKQHTPLIAPDVISFADVDINKGFVGAVMLLWGKRIILVEENWALYSITSYAAQGVKKAATSCKGALPAWVRAFYEAIDIALVKKFVDSDEERRKMLPGILKSDVDKHYTKLIKLRMRKEPKEGESETLDPKLELSVAMKNGMFDISVKRCGETLQYPQQVGDFTYVPGQKGKVYKCNEVHWSCYDFYKVNVPKWGLRQPLLKLDVRPGAGAAGGKAAPDLATIRAMQAAAAGAQAEPVYYQAQEAAAAPASAPALAPAPTPAPAPVDVNEDEPNSKRIKLV
jgi:hypothetical protein